MINVYIYTILVDLPIFDLHFNVNNVLKKI